MKRGVALLDAIPRLGWVTAPSPVSSCPELARELGLAELSIKRDDLLLGLLGGSKLRKLDYLLAAEPWKNARGLHGIGAIGSGLLATLSVACAALGKELYAHCFPEPLDPYVLDNLALVAGKSHRLFYYRSRLALALRRPALFRRAIVDGHPVVPPGASNALGALGAVHAGLELGEQIRCGVIAPPDVIYVAIGSMGTAAGLSVGLAMAEVRTRIIGVSAIEKAFSRHGAFDAQVQGVCAMLTKYGVSGVSQLRPVPVSIARRQLGGGYGQPTRASLEACASLARHGLLLEPVYTGKAMAALLAGEEASGARRVLFWQTRRGAGPSVTGDWHTRLPDALRALVA